MLREEDEKYKEKIIDIETKISNLRKELEGLKKDCSHSVITSKTTGQVVCAICGKELGWECWNSPDNVCHYFTKYNPEEGRFIELRGGKKHQIPIGHYNDTAENIEKCIFCGKPWRREVD